jgi:hypothetical protein
MASSRIIIRILRKPKVEKPKISSARMPEDKSFEMEAGF